jgi:hypothetical protein
MSVADEFRVWTAKESECLEQAGKLWRLRASTEGIRNAIVWWKPKDRYLIAKPAIQAFVNELRHAREVGFITRDDHLKLVRYIDRIEADLDRNELGDALLAMNTLDDDLMDATLEALVNCACPK